MPLHDAASVDASIQVTLASVAALWMLALAWSEAWGRNHATAEICMSWNGLNRLEWLRSTNRSWGV